jgi:spore germination protein KB
LYLIARKIELGNFIQRTDAFFIFLWILSIFCYLSIVVFMINRTMKKLFKVSNEKMLTFSNCSILFGLTILPLNISQLRFIENTLYRYTILIVIFGIGITIMILANLKFKLKGKKKV